MLNSVLKMMNFVLNNVEFCTKNDESFRCGALVIDKGKQARDSITKDSTVRTDMLYAAYIHAGD